MPIELMSALVLNEALRRVQATLGLIHSSEERGVLHIHMAPVVEVATIDVARLNGMVGLVASNLARLGKSDVLSFREVDGHLFLGRIQCANTVISIYPLQWLARQISNRVPCPCSQVIIAKADLAA